MLQTLFDMGVYIQMNAGSITGEEADEDIRSILELLKSEGVTVVEVTDKAPWVAACEEVITANTSDQAELYATLVGLQ